MKPIVWFVDEIDPDILNDLFNVYSTYIDFLENEDITDKIEIDNINDYETIKSKCKKILFVSLKKQELPEPNLCLENLNHTAIVNNIKSKIEELNFLNTPGYNSEQEKEIEKHLEDLGYI